MATRARTSADQAAYSAVVAFVDRNEHCDIHSIRVRRADGFIGQLPAESRVSLPIVRWLVENSYVAISDDGETWHRLADVLAYCRACAKSDRIWRGLW